VSRPSSAQSFVVVTQISSGLRWSLTAEPRSVAGSPDFVAAGWAAAPALCRGLSRSRSAAMMASG